MSYDVHLNCPHCGRPLLVENHSEGGTYAIGGTNEADLNITYNYGRHFAEALGYLGDPAVRNFRDFLDGKAAAVVIPALEKAVSMLGTTQAADYWDAVPGNAGHALAILLAWAKQHPDGIFSVR